MHKNVMPRLREVGILLGLGKRQLAAFENGAYVLQATHRLILSLAMDEDVFKKMYERNKHKIGAIERRRIERAEKLAKAGFDEVSEEQKEYNMLVNEFYREGK